MEPGGQMTAVIPDLRVADSRETRWRDARVMWSP